MAEGLDSNVSSSLSPAPSPPLDCPEYGNNSDYYIDEVHWWVEGVFQTTVAIPGLAGKSVDLPKPAGFTNFPLTLLIMWIKSASFENISYSLNLFFQDQSAIIRLGITLNFIIIKIMFTRPDSSHGLWPFSATVNAIYVEIKYSFIEWKEVHLVM